MLREGEQYELHGDALPGGPGKGIARLKARSHPGIWRLVSAPHASDTPRAE